ncbi:MAG: 50S ribosomal protein L29 [Candidatus Lloydbacteria bacterium RIFCSPHIGHO2_01_FULL_41_20]|uniref:Large ribosomal subunit protein uL29 n=1 Tax=Candidatus Lloydbacteria bacterium RIFCSPHIGHO2_01_FULL_41_20 TaxID=1798657 RepID=A0A1G2CRM9_9BACT|nr:MAG: 50S ribosomal protein L29 [Candidatus Lloydbacteria bacterium RIFCSPHIGHO2_01_FULL_41_20]
MSEFKSKKVEDLVKLLSEKREALRMFRFGISGSKTKNVKEGKGLRKEIAQIMTELASR